MASPVIRKAKHEKRVLYVFFLHDQYKLHLSIEFERSFESDSISAIVCERIISWALDEVQATSTY
jgi:hypothetical protein